MLVLVVCALSTTTAAAQHNGVHIKRPFQGQRATELNLHGGLSHEGLGPAVGVRVAIPIVDNGFVSAINNAIYLTVGADILFERCTGCEGKWRNDYGPAFAIPITGRWQFNFNPDWSAYGEVGPNIYIHRGWVGGDGLPKGKHLARHWLVGSVGGKYHFGATNSLTLSLGFPYSHVGIDIAY